jgi:hypothetical protein
VELMTRFGTMGRILNASFDSICEVSGIKPNSAILLKLVSLLRSHCQSDGPSEVQPAVQERRREKPRVPTEFSSDRIPTPLAVKSRISKRQIRPRGTDLFGKAVLREAIQMLPKLPDTENLNETRDFLRRNLHFSAEETRRRYANYITRRMFPQGIADTPLRTFARFYPSTVELSDVCFYRFFKAEPLMLRIAEDLLLPGLGPGRISRQKIKTYLASRFPGAGSINDCSKAIVDALDAAGIVQSDRTDIRFQSRPIQQASFAFILHSEFPEPGIYDIEKVESNPCMRALLWESAQTISALYECRNRGWISNVSQIDKVRQFTLRYHLEEWVFALAKDGGKP